MNKEQFWTIIEQSRGVISNTEIDGNFARQAESIRASLMSLEAPEIVAFNEIFHELSQQLYNWDLWGAAYVMGGGCSDDSFMDFRSWVISLGEKNYELALQAPDELGPVSQEPGVEDVFFEELSYVADDVYEEKFDDEIDTDFEYLAEPKGEQWDENEVGQLYPKLSKIYD